MTKWITPARHAIYNINAAFKALEEIDWRQRANVEIGDIVYIYCSKPDQKVMYKAEVVGKDIAPENIIDDKEFWNDMNEYQNAKYIPRYMRLRLMSQANRDELALDKLVTYGLKCAPQGCRKVPDSLANYIDQYI